jgi:hypothetical protein
MFRQSITMRNWDSIGYNWIAIIDHCPQLFWPAGLTNIQRLAQPGQRGP